MGNIRVFTSLNLDHHVKQTVSSILEESKEKFGVFALKWENPEKLHLTLRFLGSIEERKVDDLCKDFGELTFDFDKIVFKSNEIGFFPNHKRPNVMYIGLDEIGNSVNTLIEWIDGIMLKYGIDQSLRKQGLNRGDKKFVGHITLGRFRRENKIKVDESKIVTFEPFLVEFDRFYLMESVLDSHGSKYYPLKQFVFKKLEQSEINQF